MSLRGREAPQGLADFAGLLRRHGVHPDKRLGQHFLFDPAALHKVVAAAGLQGDETVLEVGAGVGSLTCRLGAAAGHVLAVEIDRRLIPALEEAVAGFTNVEILQCDVLSLDLETLVGRRPYLVVANIPYQITSQLIRWLLEAPRPPRALVLTIQREVAERIVAQAGEMSLLALSVQLYGSPRVMDRIPAGAFTPPPNVDSAILRVDVFAEPRVPSDRIAGVFLLARLGFNQKRKQLRNALSGGLHVPAQEIAAWLEEAGLQPQARAQELRWEDWSRLAEGVRRRQGLPAVPPSG